MTVTPIALSGPINPATDLAPARVSGAAPFGNMVDRALGGAAESHQAADAAVRDLVMGRTENMHGVLMQVAQADLTFRMILEIRNRLIESYQDIMKMQV